MAGEAQHAKTPHGTQAHRDTAELQWLKPRQVVGKYVRDIPATFFKSQQSTKAPKISTPNCGLASNIR